MFRPRIAAITAVAAAVDVEALSGAVGAAVPAVEARAAALVVVPMALPLDMGAPVLAVAVGRNMAAATFAKAMARGYGPGGGYPGGPGPRGYGGPARGFTRGQFLPPAYLGGAVADPRQYHLRRPPNGYGWVTVGPNAYLTQRSTGLILDTAPLY